VAAKKDPGKAKLTLDKMKFPPGSILVIVEDVREALGLLPKGILITPEEYQRQLEQNGAPKAPVRKQPSVCKLTGKLEEDYLALRAEFTFSTEQPRTVVTLGLKGAHPSPDAELDREAPLLVFGDDGFSVRVEKEGVHQLALNLRVPVEAKKSAAGERGFELELPGAAVNSMSLELPANVKEIRVNDRLDKTRKDGRWHPDLFNIKKLALSWKEPVALAGTGPLPNVDGEVDVRLSETQVLVKADLYLVDRRGQMREWQLLLPPQATADVTPPAGLGYQLLPPDGKNPYHVLRCSEANNERWKVSVKASQPRPAPGQPLPLGPFYVEGVERQKGTIAIQAPAEALHGQRLVYHRTGEVFQKDLPKSPSSPDLVAVFEYWAASPAKGPRGPGAPRLPLEVEIRSEKGQVETRTEHTVKLRPATDAWEIEVTTRLQAKALVAGGDTLDVQLPPLRPRGVETLAFVPGAAFPGAVPWAALAGGAADLLPGGMVGDFQARADGGAALEMAPLDRHGRWRIALPRSLDSKPFVTILSGKYLVPRARLHLRLDLPRPVGTLDRDARVQVDADEQIELLVG